MKTQAKPFPARRQTMAMAAALLAALALFAASAAWHPARSQQADAAAPALKTVVASAAEGAGLASFDGTVQAVRQTTLAAQVAGAVMELSVRPGDMVKAGQVLMRLDARAARQSAAAGAAQALAAQAGQDAATREFERQKQLFEKRYISQAALDRAEAQYKASHAEAAAQLANAGAARTQSDLFTIRAPYAGVVSEVPVVQGDMAMPGRALVTLYDPAALRVSAAIPQGVAARLGTGTGASAEVPGAAAQRIAPTRVQLLPAVDPATHTRELRLDLPAGQAGLAPGMFARAWLPGAPGAGANAWIPAQSVLRRAELVGVYVVGEDGRPLLRQVRLGRSEGERVEVISGLAAGERVAADPQAAARIR